MMLDFWFPWNFFGFSIFSKAILIIFWLFAIMHCLTSKLDSKQKIFWIIAILVLPFFGAIIYFIFLAANKGRIMNNKNLKGKRLYRSKSNRIIAGVCAGIGEYLDIDPTVVRLLWVLFTLVSMGAGIVAYIIAWVIMPEGK